MSDYHINIFASAEDEGYVADIPDLVCCSAFGATPEEALAEVQRAKAAWLEAARALQANRYLNRNIGRPFIRWRELELMYQATWEASPEGMRAAVEAGVMPEDETE